MDQSQQDHSGSGDNVGRDKHVHIYHTSKEPLLKPKPLILISVSICAFIILFYIYRENFSETEVNNTSSILNSNDTLTAESTSVDETIPIKDTVGQYERYKSLLVITNELIENSDKAYDIHDAYLRSLGDCSLLKQAIKINKPISSSTKLLLTKLGEDAELSENNEINDSALKDLVLTIDQWDEDYNKRTLKHTSSCKMPLFAPLQFVLIRDDLVQLKDIINQRLKKN